MKNEQYENRYKLASKKAQTGATAGAELALQNGIGLNSHWSS
jgi:hypothetical protein